MNLVDSSGWLEYFADGPAASLFAAPILKTSELVVPTISLFEVFKKVLMQRGESLALQAAAVMQQGVVVELSSALALSAAKLSAAMHLPMADSLILATAWEHDALLWTQDAHFEGLRGVRFVAAR
jgi:toxin FitB